MSHRPRALVAWSSGKDAAYALEVARREGALEVAELFTTVSAARGVVPIHGVPRWMVEAQCEAVGLPWTAIELPDACDNATYLARTGVFLRAAYERGITHVIYGDLFLEDIRAFREQQLAEVGLVGAYPLWGRETRALAHEMIDAGLRAIVVSVDRRALDDAWVGRAFDAAFVRELPAGVDPCGERGEFHTFVTHAPSMRREIEARVRGVAGVGGNGVGVFGG